MTGGCYYSRVSDTEQGGIPTSASPASDAPAPEAVPAEVIAAPPASADAVPDISIDEATLAAPPTQLSDSPPPADTPAEITDTEHTNILENVGMSSEANDTNAPSAPPVSDNASAPVPPPIEPSAPAGGAAYAALLAMRDQAQSAIQFRRQARLEKIMALVETKRSIGNDEVEKLLRVSNATASRYLSTLVRDGKLKRLGLPHASRYTSPTGSNGAVWASAT